MPRRSVACERGTVGNAIKSRFLLTRGLGHHGVRMWWFVYDRVCCADCGRRASKLHSPKHPPDYGSNQWPTRYRDIRLLSCDGLASDGVHLPEGQPIETLFQWSIPGTRSGRNKRCQRSQVVSVPSRCPVERSRLAQNTSERTLLSQRSRGADDKATRR